MFCGYACGFGSMVLVTVVLVDFVGCDLFAMFVGFCGWVGGALLLVIKVVGMLILCLVAFGLVWVWLVIAVCCLLCLVCSVVCGCR